MEIKKNVDLYKFEKKYFITKYIIDLVNVIYKSAVFFNTKFFMYKMVNRM